MPEPMLIPSTAVVIADCWMAAERALRRLVRKKYFDPDEEHLTFLFTGELRQVITSERTRVSLRNAFRQDLEVALDGHLPWFELDKYTDVVGKVVFYPRKLESKTKADFGIVLKRPLISFSHPIEQPYRREAFCRRGLLCQAKVTQRGSKAYGELDPEQIKKFSESPQAYSLTLYEFLDEMRTVLEPFQWFPCGGEAATQAAGFLKEGFPSGSLVTSRQVILDLANERSGTADENIIGTANSPEVRPTYEILITWRGDEPDEIRSLSSLSTTSEARAHNVVQVFRKRL